MRKKKYFQTHKLIEECFWSGMLKKIQYFKTKGQLKGVFLKYTWPQKPHHPNQVSSTTTTAHIHTWYAIGSSPSKVTKAQKTYWRCSRSWFFSFWLTCQLSVNVNLQVCSLYGTLRIASRKPNKAKKCPVFGVFEIYLALSKKVYW